ncbi:MAG TPA: DUF4097 family beta strand repeat-containing protein [Acidobacteriaceae bacterium]|nr:DUF4097 family beta strand repeat-containing protein [Acidobacteriaceae bacterium]
MQRAAYRSTFRGTAHRSILGPVFLIAIGVFALLVSMHRLNAEYFWHWYGHWWPLLLIGAGVLLAIESLFLAGQSRVRLGGGVVFLVILLALVGIIAAHNHVNWQSVGDQLQLGDNMNLAQMFGNKHQDKEQIAHALPAGASVVIQNGHGDVILTAGNDDQMHLTVDKTVYTGSDREATRELNALEPLITSAGTVVTVHMPSNDSHVADMTITLPAATPVQVRVDHGDVTISGRKATVNVNSNQGDVELTSIVGATQVAMHQGDFTGRDLEGNFAISGRMNDVSLSQVTGSSTLTGDFFGEVNLDHLLGPVHLHSSRTQIQAARVDGRVSLSDGDLTMGNAIGPVLVSTRAMDISLKHIQGQVTVKNSDGSIAVNVVAPVGEMDIANRNGSVDVTVPDNGKFSVKGVASDGEITSDFKLSQTSENDRATASGEVGGGGPLLHIATEKGDIHLRKAGADTDDE